MKKILTVVIVAGLGLYVYNQYKKAKNTNKVKLK
jgi:hypothetical protein